MLIEIYKKIKYKFLRFVKTKFNIDTLFNYNHFSIFLPPEHALPMYKRIFSNYDRFLPHLGSYLEPSAVVVDVGANVGDTLAGMADVNSNLSFVCIEPDDIFFRYLEINSMRILKANNFTTIKNIKSLVGKKITNVSLDGKNGTKHAVVGSNLVLASKSLDFIFHESDLHNIRLLKVDVDGFDWDVIDSGVELIKSQQPMIFFECQYDHDYQIEGYRKTLNLLSSLGYINWTIFDNFGALLLRTDNINNILQIMEYVLRQNLNQATRTFYYCDILAVTDKDVTMIDLALKKYH